MQTLTLGLLIWAGLILVAAVLWVTVKKPIFRDRPAIETDVPSDDQILRLLEDLDMKQPGTTEANPAEQNGEQKWKH